MPISMSDLSKRLSDLEERVKSLEGNGEIGGRKSELNPHLPICEACGEGNKKMVAHIVRDDVFGKEMNAKMKVYECNSCAMKTTVNDRDD